MMSALQPGGPVAQIIDRLWWLMLILGTVVFVLVVVLLARGLTGRNPQGEADLDEKRRLSRRWVLAGGALLPVAVLTGIFGATVGAMRAMPRAGARDALIIDIVGRQWSFEVTYPGEGITARDEMHLPVGRPIELRLASVDVIHSFWVPQLGGKMDMLPDKVNTLVLQADRPGDYVSRCAEFCGLHHAHMKLRVVAEPAESFAAWLASRR